jgi:hypothetical protein
MSRRAQRTKIDRHRLGVDEQEWRVHEQEQAEQQDGPERVDVPERIEADAAESPRGVVPERLY